MLRRQSDLIRVFAVAALLLAIACVEAAGVVYVTDQLSTDLALRMPVTFGIEPRSDPNFAEAQFQQPLITSQEAASSTQSSLAASAASQQLATSLAGFGGDTGFGLSGYAIPSIDFATNEQAFLRATTDAGSMLGGLPSVTSTGVQRRNPIVTDPRVRGSRVGSLAASGSYWVPARLDLDTIVSKIDSRIVEAIAVTPGPYSALSGPGYNFVRFDLLPTPRYANGFESHGRTSFDFRDNGEQWYGRQAFHGGDDLWGYRLGYGHRTGNDYESGAGVGVPSSYKSRDINAAVGAQLTTNDAVEFNYLRIDQTDVELAGQAFDIDWLVTDGYEVQYVREQPVFADRLVIDTWYNRTRFEGSAQAAKRQQFPLFDFTMFEGFTDVDSTSTGAQAAWVWDGANGDQLIAGADFRFVKQELNEITSGILGFADWNDANSPIPNSDYANPGLFAELRLGEPNDGGGVRVGGRLDYVGTSVRADPSEIALLGTGMPQSSAGDIWGSDALSSDELLGLVYLAADYEPVEDWVLGASVGYSERAPNLTERYAVESFMFLLQSGLNTVTGDPLLDKERLIQTDVRLSHTTSRFRGSVGAYHAWINDYITFEALGTRFGPPTGIQQVNLKYVNTDLATLWGVEGRAEYDLTRRVTPFATLQYVEGQDQTRNGEFATRAATPGSPSERVAGRPRGDFTSLGGGAEEPLPGILPLESRIGVRFDDGCPQPRWGCELACRVVDNQHRVAASLNELPTPGFTTWDVRGFWQARDRLLLIAGVENFTDKDYREHLDFRSLGGLSVFRPGVTFYTGATLEY